MYHKNKNVWTGVFCSVVKDLLGIKILSSVPALYKKKWDNKHQVSIKVNLWRTGEC